MADEVTNEAGSAGGDSETVTLAGLIPGGEFLPKVKTAPPETAEGEDVTVTGDDPTAGVEAGAETPEEVAAGDATKKRDASPDDGEVEHRDEPVQKRIDRLHAQKKEAQEERDREKLRAETAERELAELKRRDASPDKGSEGKKAETSSEPLANVTSEADLQGEIQNALWWQEWAALNPDGGEVELGGKTVALDATQARLAGVRANRLLTVDAPRRRAYLIQQSQITEAVRADYPELLDATSEAHAETRELLKAWPELRRFPDHLQVLGDYRAGKAARLARAAEAAKAGEQGRQPGAATTEPGKKPAVENKKPIPKAPPVPGTSTKPMVPAQEQQQRAAREKALRSGGDIDSLAAAM